MEAKDAEDNPSIKETLEWNDKMCTHVSHLNVYYVNQVTRALHSAKVIIIPFALFCKL